MRRTTLAFAIAIGLGACSSGSQGPAGLPGTNGTNGMPGMPGMNGNNVVISAEAKHGLDISSFPLNTTGMTAAQIEQLGRGSYLVNAVIDCAGCHTADPTKPFGGGVPFPIDASGHVVFSRNISALGYSEDAFIQILRTGADLKNAGQQLLVMPWPTLRWLTDYDIKAVYAYVKLIPAVTTLIPPDNKGLAAAATPVPFPSTYNEGEEPRPLPPVVMGKAEPDPGNAVRGTQVMPLAYAKMPNFAMRTPAEQAAFGRGSYLVNAAGLCNDCHTNLGGLPRSFTPGPTYLAIPADSYLIGGAVFSVPPPLNPILKQTRTMSKDLIGKTNGFFNETTMTFNLFDGIIQAMAHIDDPIPLPLGWPMPADHFRNMTIEDLTAVYTYLRVLAKDYTGSTQADKKTQSQARYCTTATQATDCRTGETCVVDSATPARVGNQCIGATCTLDSDCDACQKCTTTRCAAPAASDACLAAGI